jgi:hypothetical protein
MLVEYVSLNDIYIGCVVALDKGVVGWSQCNVDKDQFDKKRAREIAMGRAVKGTKKIPRRYYGEDLIGNAVIRMKDRARSYFQDNYFVATKETEALYDQVFNSIKKLK